MTVDNYLIGQPLPLNNVLVLALVRKRRLLAQPLLVFVLSQRSNFLLRKKTQKLALVSKRRLLAQPLLVRESDALPAGVVFV